MIPSNQACVWAAKQNTQWIVGHKPIEHWCGDEKETVVVRLLDSNRSSNVEFAQAKEMQNRIDQAQDLAKRLREIAEQHPDISEVLFCAANLLEKGFE